MLGSVADAAQWDEVGYIGAVAFYEGLEVDRFELA
jgi:hypothetical protein